MARGGDGLVDVVACGPQGELGVHGGAAVVQGAAEAGGELGEDGLDGGGSRPVEGLAPGVKKLRAAGTFGTAHLPPLVPQGPLVQFGD